MNVALAGTAHHVERIVRGWRRVDAKVEAQEAARRATEAARFTSTRKRTAWSSSAAGSSPRWARCVMQTLAAAREALYRRRRAGGRPARTIRRRMRRRSASSRPTRWPCSPRRPCTMASSRARRPSATRSWSRGRPVLADADQPGSRSWRTASTFPRDVQRLACDATRVIMRHDADGRVVEVGAARGRFPAMRRALQHRDHGCRFPAADAFTQGHHIRHWAHGGRRRCRILRCYVAAPSGGAPGRLRGRAAGHGASVPAPGRPAPPRAAPVPVPHDPLGDFARGTRPRACACTVDGCGSWPATAST